MSYVKMSRIITSVDNNGAVDKTGSARHYVDMMLLDIVFMWLSELRHALFLSCLTILSMLLTSPLAVFSNGQELEPIILALSNSVME